MTLAKKDAEGVYNTKTSDGDQWVLVYDDNGVITAQENHNQQTSSQNKVETFTTEAKMLSRIADLGFEAPEEEPEHEWPTPDEIPPGLAELVA